MNMGNIVLAQLTAERRIAELTTQLQQEKTKTKRAEDEAVARTVEYDTAREVFYKENHLLLAQNKRLLAERDAARRWSALWKRAAKQQRWWAENRLDDIRYWLKWWRLGCDSRARLVRAYRQAMRELRAQRKGGAR